MGGSGCVFIIPDLIFSVSLGRAIPGAQVAAWDRKIADALVESEKQDKRFLKALGIVGDCYQKHALSSTMIGRFQYQPIDQDAQPFRRGEVTISEQIVVVQGGSLVRGGIWGAAQQNADGSFYNYVGKQNPWGG